MDVEGCVVLRYPVVYFIHNVWGLQRSWNQSLWTLRDNRSYILGSQKLYKDLCLGGRCPGSPTFFQGQLHYCEGLMRDHSCSDMCSVSTPLVLNRVCRRGWLGGSLRMLGFLSQSACCFRGQSAPSYTTMAPGIGPQGVLPGADPPL